MKIKSYVASFSLLIATFNLNVNECISQNRTTDKLTDKEIYDLTIYSDERWGGLKPFLSNGKWGFKGDAGKEVIPAIYDAIKKPKYYNGPKAKYILVQKGKWGIIDIKGNQIISFIHEDIEFFYSCSTSKVIAKTNGKWGLLDLNNKYTVPSKYDSIAQAAVYNSWVWFRLNNKCGYLDCRNGQVVFPPIYDYVGTPDNKKVKVILGKSVGLSDLKGKPIIPVRYDDVDENIMLNTVKVKLNGKWGVVDTLGKEIFPIRYDYISYYTLGDSGVANVQLNKKYGSVDTKGQEVIPIIYDQIYSQVILCCTAVRIGDKFGIISRSGKVILPVKYEDIARMYDGTLWPAPPPTKAKLNGKWGYIDSSGKEATPMKYDEINFQFAPVVPVKLNSKWAFIDKLGKEITPFKYDAVDFLEAVFLCNIGDKYGIVDFSGKEITPFIYQQIVSFSSLGFENTIAVRINDRWGFIDNKGKVTVEPKYEYDEIKPFKEGLAAVKKNDHWGYINKAGTIVISIKYDETTGYFKDGQTGVNIDGKWGLVDKTGKIIQQLESEYDLMFSDE